MMYLSNAMRRVVRFWTRQPLHFRDRGHYTQPGEFLDGEW